MQRDTYVDKKLETYIYHDFKSYRNITKFVRNLSNFSYINNSSRGEFQKNETLRIDKNSSFSKLKAEYCLSQNFSIVISRMAGARYIENPLNKKNFYALTYNFSTDFDNSYININYASELDLKKELVISQNSKRIEDIWIKLSKLQKKIRKL